MSKKINVNRDLESRARIAFQSKVPMPEPIADQPVEVVELQKVPDDAQSKETVRTEVDQSPVTAEKSKKTGRAAKRNPQTV